MFYRQMVYFCSVVRTGSFTKAAAECGVSQSAISQQIKALERDLGTELLLRRGRGVVLSESGRKFYSRACGIIKEMDDLYRETSDGARLGSRGLCAGLLSRYVGVEVREALSVFAAERAPGGLAVRAASHVGLMTMLRSGQADVAVIDRRGPFAPELESRFLGTLRSYADLAAASELAHRPELTMDDLIPVPYVLVASKDEEGAERRYYGDLFDAKMTFLRASSLEEGHMMVVGNRGAMVVDAGVGAQSPNPAISRVPLRGLAGPLRQDYYAVWPKASSNLLVPEFAETLARCFGGSRAAGALGDSR